MGYKFVGEDGGDYSGHSVSSAGDVDGDGNDDLLIGADLADDGGGSNSGSTYLINADDLAALDAADGSTDGVISLANVYCFAEGTGVATPSGETPVEHLKIGDLVRTADGREVAAIWIGRQTLSRNLAGERAQLVRIAAGSLGNHRDLFVTADHGMVLDGLVINASALVNGDSINWVAMSETPEVQTVYHVETAAHDVILANGAACETYLDIPGRRAFDNYQEYLDLYGAERIIPEMDRLRISSRRLLPEAIRARLGIGEEAIAFDMPLLTA